MKKTVPPMISRSESSLNDRQREILAARIVQGEASPKDWENYAKLSSKRINKLKGFRSIRRRHLQEAS